MMDSVAFSIPKSYTGVVDAEGLARLDEDALVLEFVTKEAIVEKQRLAWSLCACIGIDLGERDKVVGLSESDVNEVRIPISALDSAELEQRVFKTELVLQARTMKTLNEVPGNSRGELRLRIARKHRGTARQLVSGLTLKLSDVELERLDEEIRGMGA